MIPASSIRLCVLLCALAGCASHKPLAPTDVPATLKVADGQVLTAALHGTGVQIYECRASAQDPKRFGWVYHSPAAELSDRSGKEVGRHYDGPTWEGYDGSKVVGEVAIRDNAPDPAAAIQWLLLRSKSNSGKGIFAKTQFIQRLHTIGGITPTAICDAGHAGQRTRVAYSADYYFYAARR
ncbi:MAG TPA: DUF3455 domain-containing protein [Steroidobacteraceae bacterium]|jgi:hypothetical protein|nr:DUF3455 domain-containing protein [Steroidobacteraceae bacterium]